MPERLHCVHTSSDECPDTFKGVVRALIVASGHGYCLQSAHLELQHDNQFTRKPANFPSHRGWEGLRSNPLSGGAASTLDASASPARTGRKASDTEEKISGNWWDPTVTPAYILSVRSPTEETYASPLSASAEPGTLQETREHTRMASGQN